MEKTEAVSAAALSAALTSIDGLHSIPKFGGDDKDHTYSSVKWSQDIEDNAEIFGWSAQQKLVIARRSLTGTAALWLKTEKVHKTFEELKNALQKEFPETINTKEMHELMVARKKKRDESYHQYMLVMKEMGKRAKFPDYVTIQYIIDGIIENEVNKSILYGAQTYPVLKEKLLIYEKIMEKMKPKSGKQDRVEKKEPEKFQKTFSSRRRCYNCGDESHIASTCPNGLKCFRCNQFGHIGVHCTNQDATTTKTRYDGSSGASKRDPPAHHSATGHQSHSTGKQTVQSEAKQRSAMFGVMTSANQEQGVNGGYDDLSNVTVRCHDVLLNSDSTTQTITNSSNANKTVIIGDKSVIALIDSGSDINLITEQFFEVTGLSKIKDDTILSGFGHVKISSCGKIFCDMYVDGWCYKNVIFHVVPKQCMPYDVILGHEFLKDVVMIMREGSVCVLPKEEEWLSRVHCCENVVDIAGTNEVKTEVMNLVDAYTPVKTKEAPLELKIVLKDDVPVAQRPRRLSYTEQKIVEDQVDDWLKTGVVQVSYSEYSSPLVLVKKKDGSTRVCVDYRLLNKKIVKDEFPLPLIEDLIDKLKDAKLFNVLDLKNGFFHLRVSKESVPYTSFVTHHGQFEFLRAPFGLSVSPKYFMRFVTIIFRDLIAQNIMMIFIDDIVIPAQDERQAVQRLRQVLDVASNYGLEINWKKAKLVSNQIEYLGHLIQDGEVRPSPGKIDAVARFPEPRNTKQVQSFIGLTSYFRKYIKDYAEIAKPLTQLLKKEVEFRFEDEQRHAFDILKQKLTSDPVLKIFDPNLPTELHTDASSQALAAILMQQHTDGGLHPVHYMSHKTSDAESRYSSYELEALAIVQGVKKFRHYLYGIHFKIVTDCQAFKLTLKKKDLTPKVARWALLLDEYDYEIEHRSGEKMQHADALSRNPGVAKVMNLRDEIRRAQEEDDEVNAIRQIILKDGKYSDYWMDNGIIFKGEEKQLLVPKSMEKEIIRRVHQNGHFSARKMKNAIGKDYYIRNMDKKIEEVILSCIPCLLARRKTGKQEGYLYPIEKEATPLHTLHLDHIGPLTETRKMYNHILTVVDAFTKFVWLFPTKSTSSAEVLNKLQVHQQTFGNPTRVITDRGTAFTSNDFKKYCEEENIQHTMITTGVPRGNGQVERIHRILIPMLAKLSLEDKSLWYKHVSRVQRALNSTYQRSIDTSPFQLLTGAKMKCKQDVEILQLLQKETIEQFNEDRECLREKAKMQIQKVQDENKDTYDKKRKTSSKYDVDDIVAIKRTQFGPGLKLKPKFLGPYKVVKVKRNDRYDVEKLNSDTEGPYKTSSAADLMKRWPVADDD